MAVTTLTTVGFREVHDLGDAGRVFTIAFIAAGVLVVGVNVAAFARFLVEGEIRDFMEKKRAKKGVDQLRDHYIICGFGRIGRVIADELAAHKVPFVVVDSSPDTVEEIARKGYPAVHGDSVNEQVMLAAGIKRAKGLVAAVGSPADNVYITISAKALNPQIFVLGRAHDETTEKRLLTAGADRVVSPYSIGGRRMANIILRPAVVEFFDLTTDKKDIELAIEELHVRRGSVLIGKTIVDSEVRTKFGAIIVAIARPSERMVFNPPPQTVILEDDVLIALGAVKDLTALSSAVSKGKRRAV
jgi:voltage-gated potassium channel